MLKRERKQYMCNTVNAFLNFLRFVRFIKYEFFLQLHDPPIFFKQCTLHFRDFISLYRVALKNLLQKQIFISSNPCAYNPLHIYSIIRNQIVKNWTTDVWNSSIIVRTAWAPWKNYRVRTNRRRITQRDRANVIRPGCNSASPIIFGQRIPLLPESANTRTANLADRCVEKQPNMTRKQTASDWLWVSRKLTWPVTGRWSFNARRSFDVPSRITSEVVFTILRGHGCFVSNARTLIMTVKKCFQVRFGEIGTC